MTIRFKYSGNCDFPKPPRETTIGSKNRGVREMGASITECSTEGRETSFGSSYREFRKMEGFTSVFQKCSSSCKLVILLVF